MPAQHDSLSQLAALVMNIWKAQKKRLLFSAQEDSDGESGSTALAEEPYLMNNPAYEAYLDSESASPGSVESNACTTPRSAIQEQVPLACDFA